MASIQADTPRKAEGGAKLPQPETKPEYEDDDLVTVLYGFGKVLPTQVTLLDGYEVKGGVIRDVPYSIAKHWFKGTRPDGKRPHGRVKVTILPQDASEDDFAAAAGLTREEQRKLAAILSVGDIAHIFDDLGLEKSRKLRDALSRYIETK